MDLCNFLSWATYGLTAITKTNWTWALGCGEYFPNVVQPVVLYTCSKTFYHQVKSSNQIRDKIVNNSRLLHGFGRNEVHILTKGARPEPEHLCFHFFFAHCGHSCRGFNFVVNYSPLWQYAKTTQEKRLVLEEGPCPKGGLGVRVFALLHPVCRIKGVHSAPCVGVPIVHWGMARVKGHESVGGRDTLLGWQRKRPHQPNKYLLAPTL